MRHLLIALLLGLFLSGCVHKMDIEQGNIITPDMISQLHPGLTLKEVKDIMGPPMLMNTFNDDRVDYVYSFKPGGGTMTEKYITLNFNKRGVLKEINGNMYSAYRMQ